MFGHRSKLPKGEQPPPVFKGAVFRHYGPGQRVETALVLKLLHDHRNITHVQYVLQIERASCSDSEKDLRTLSLQDFRKHYQVSPVARQ